MVMANDPYGSIATPRLFVDYLQYARAIGNINRYKENKGGFWDLDPTTITETTNFTTGGDCNLYIYFQNEHILDDSRGFQFGRLLETTNYFGLLGHNIGICSNTADINQYHIGFSGHNPDGTSATVTATGFDDSLLFDRNNIGNEIGYSLCAFDGWSFGTGDFHDHAWEEMRLVINTISTSPFVTGDVIKVGSVTAGRYFNFPHSVNMDFSVSTEYTGIKTERTQGGSDLININYYKPKMWGDLPAWTAISGASDLTNYTNNSLARSEALRIQNYRTTSKTGKRVFSLKFSFLNKEDTFPKTFEDSMRGNISTTTGDITVEDNVLAYLNYTMGGKIPHIIQPDNTKRDFAIVTGSDVKISQQAPNMYQFSTILREV